MRKFVVQSVKGATSIVEVEYEVMSKFYSYTLKEGEWMGKITAPTFLYEKDMNNKLVPPVWCWWAFYDSVNSALEYLNTSFTESIVRAGQKQSRLAGTVYEPLTLEQLDSQVHEMLSKVNIILL